jgi:hypothetical protein
MNTRALLVAVAVVVAGPIIAACGSSNTDTAVQPAAGSSGAAGVGAAPIITNLVLTPTCSSFSATWTTNVASDSSIAWGATATCDLGSATNASRVTSHGPLASTGALSGGTTYQVCVTSCSAGRSPCATQTASVTTTEPRILVGFTTWSAYMGGYSRCDMSYLTHLCFANIAPTDKDHRTLQAAGGWAAVDAAVTKAHNAGKKAVVSYADNFPEFADSPTNLAELVTNIKDMCTERHLDGIYVDSEGSATSGQRVALVAALYDAVHPLGIQIGYYSDGLALPIELSQYVDWVDVTFSAPTGDIDSEDKRFADYVSGLQVLQGWPKAKLNTVFMVYAFTGPPHREESCSYGDVVDAGLDVHASKGDIVAIDSLFYGANHAIPGGVLYWDGINLNQRKTDYILSNGYGGAMFFACDYDTSDSASSLIGNVYQGLGSP